jgi:hypothetical protein
MSVIAAAKSGSLDSEPIMTSISVDDGKHFESSFKVFFFAI